MPFRIKVSLAIVALLVALAVVVPLVLPIAPLEGTRPVSELAGPDARFVDAAGVRLHVATAGPPADPAAEDATAFVLLHGFGSGTFTWRAVQGGLAALGPVVAYDRPGFGLTPRPLPGSWPRGANPYTLGAQVDQTVAVMDALGLDRAVLVGHSSGAVVALATALAHPERVSGLVLVDAAYYRQGGPPGWARWLLRTPQADRLGPVIMRQFAGTTGTTFLENSWADPSRIDDATRAAYREPLQADDWDRGLWEVSKAARPAHLDLGRIAVPTLVVTGADDAIVPPADDRRLAADMGGAPLRSLPDCGHVPQEECPQAFLDAVAGWVKDRRGASDAVVTAPAAPGSAAAGGAPPSPAHPRGATAVRAPRGSVRRLLAPSGTAIRAAR